MDLSLFLCITCSLSWSDDEIGMYRIDSHAVGVNINLHVLQVCCQFDVLVICLKRHGGSDIVDLKEGDIGHKHAYVCLHIP